MTSIAMIVACSENGVIGKDNALPWRLPEDLKYFKRTTLGKPVVMGRLTYESIGRPLPGRPNIVVTRQPTWSEPGVDKAESIKKALEIAQSYVDKSAAEEAMIIGGAQIYRESVALCNRIYLTRVHAEIDGDAFFPELKMKEWKEVSRERYAASEDQKYDYSFVVLDRIAPSFG